jgi:hypothetical protein
MRDALLGFLWVRVAAATIMPPTYRTGTDGFVPGHCAALSYVE